MKMKSLAVIGAAVCLALVMMGCPKSGQKPGESAAKKAEPAKPAKAGPKDMLDVGDKYCAALMKGDVNDFFALMHPKMIEITKSMLTAFAGMGNEKSKMPSDPWGEMIAAMNKDLKENPVTACDILSAAETKCEQKTADELKQMGLAGDKCGNVKMKVTFKIPPQEKVIDGKKMKTAFNSDSMEMSHIDGKWYIGGNAATK